jgi:hypothetical protein
MIQQRNLVLLRCPYPLPALGPEELGLWVAAPRDAVEPYGLELGPSLLLELDEPTVQAIVAGSEEVVVEEEILDSGMSYLEVVEFEERGSFDSKCSDVGGSFDEIEDVSVGDEVRRLFRYGEFDEVRPDLIKEFVDGSLPNVLEDVGPEVESEDLEVGEVGEAVGKVRASRVAHRKTEEGEGRGLSEAPEGRESCESSVQMEKMPRLRD